MSQALCTRLSGAFGVSRDHHAKEIGVVAIAAHTLLGTQAYSLLCLSFDLDILQQTFSKVDRQRKASFLDVSTLPLP